MNLHIENQKLRFRISKDELEELCSGSSLTQEIFLPNQHTLNIAIIMQIQDPILYLTFENNSITLFAKKNAIEEFYSVLPSREGLEIEQQVADNQLLKLIFEVDIRTQKRKRNK